MSHRAGSLHGRLGSFLARLFGIGKKPRLSGSQDRGILVFSNTSEVIAAERALKKAGLDVEVKGPPPDLRTGCDLVVVFPLIQQAIAEKALAAAALGPERTLPLTGTMLSPVSLCHVKDMGDWIMVRAANMKITLDKRTGAIANISGGGCPDVPWLAKELTGKKLCEAPEPLSLGHTLCCYCLQKAFEELRRIFPCG